MLFCITGEYAPQALKAMRENPDTNREAAITQLLGAAGGKLVALYGTSANGPGVMVIFDVADPEMAVATAGTAVESGALQNCRMTRLFTSDEMNRIRQKRRQIAGAYRPPGQG